MRNVKTKQKKQKNTDAFVVDNDMSSVDNVCSCSTERHSIKHIDISTATLRLDRYCPLLGAVPDNYVSITADCNTSLPVAMQHNVVCMCAYACINC